MNLPGPHHRDGCDLKSWRHSGEGYNRVIVCECGAETHDPAPAIPDPEPFKTTPEKILDVLGTNRFYDWYLKGGSLDRFITGEFPRTTREEVLADVIKMFGVK